VPRHATPLRYFSAITLFIIADAGYAIIAALMSYARVYMMLLPRLILMPLRARR